MFLCRPKMEKPYVSAVVPAAGFSTRMEGLDKQLEVLDGTPVLAHTLEALSYSDWIDELVVVTRSDMIPAVLELVKDFEILKVRSVVAGGETRQQSVWMGIQAVSPQTAYVAIHDGARPLVGQQVIAESVIEAIRYGAAAAAVPVVDTIKVANSDKMIDHTPDRSKLYAVQTPQVFRLDRYKEAMEMAKNQGKDYTDDCQMLEAIGQQVYLSSGEYTNLKITTPTDLLMAQLILEQTKEMV